MTANHKQGWKQAFLSALQSPSFERARVKRQVLTKGSQISSEFGVFGNQRARVCFSSHVLFLLLTRLQNVLVINTLSVLWQMAERGATHTHTQCVFCSLRETQNVALKPFDDGS